MAKRKPHKVQVIMNNTRYVAIEEHGHIRLSRDGTEVGDAHWVHDQLLHISTPLPDDVVHELEKKIKERMDVNWDED
ncbi:MAG: hypothetical protein HUU21_35325 [Polyangiaceae bacterium]|nr:hypothetical protein [Polyangiaceae bacterium]NUQ78827.1 hypothetical protein [Polyangiaceae bacterium]